MNLDLPLIFAGLMGAAVLAYVVLDGYDLGVGMLMPAADAREQDLMVSSIGPFWDANETWLVLGVGASFEFPLLIVLLVYMGVMTTAFLRKYRRHAIVVIFIIAAVVTPTPDPFTQTLFATPLYLLYEIAIIAGRRIEKRRAAA